MVKRKRVYHRECPTRRVPKYRIKDPVFYRCPVCGAVDIRYRPTDEKTEEDCQPGRCHGRTMERIVPCVEEEKIGNHEMRFCIFGGFSNNTIRIEIEKGRHPMQPEHHIEWIFLRTFQGGQMKYLPLKRESAALFAMANEDAFAFCDREECKMGWEQCLFQCKRGHIAYAYCNLHGLFRLEF